MKSFLIAAAATLALSTSAFAGPNAPSGSFGAAAAGTGTTTYVPDYQSAADRNVYLAIGTGGGTSIAATDQCLPGDMYSVIGIGLPGPSIDTTATDGSAEECTCSPSTGFEASAAVGGNLAIVVMTYQSGADVFPASAALRIAPRSQTATVRQIRGMDSCGITASR